jgi:hypothetical protein
MFMYLFIISRKWIQLLIDMRSDGLDAIMKDDFWPTWIIIPSQNIGCENNNKIYIDPMKWFKQHLCKPPKNIHVNKLVM